MSDSVTSRNGIAIRLTDERWSHVVEEHSEMAGLKVEVLHTIANPDRVVEGRKGALMAYRQMVPGRYLVVVYRESGDDGFVITKFSTSRTSFLENRRQLWP